MLLISVIVVVAVLQLFESCTVRRSEPIKGKTFTPDDQRIANGERVYMVHCQKCHPGGEGGLGPALNPVPAPGFVKRFQVRHGLGVMPSFKQNEIAKKDLHDITAYLRVWKHY